MKKNEDNFNSTKPQTPQGVPHPSLGENVYPIYFQGTICGYVYTGRNQETNKIYLTGEYLSTFSTIEQKESEKIPRKTPKIRKTASNVSSDTLVQSLDDEPLVEHKMSNIKANAASSTTSGPLPSISEPRDHLKIKLSQPSLNSDSFTVLTSTSLPTSSSSSISTDLSNQNEFSSSNVCNVPNGNDNFTHSSKLLTNNSNHNQAIMLQTNNHKKTTACLTEQQSRPKAMTCLLMQTGQASPVILATSANALAPLQTSFISTNTTPTSTFITSSLGQVPSSILSTTPDRAMPMSSNISAPEEILKMFASTKNLVSKNTFIQLPICSSNFSSHSIKKTQSFSSEINQSNQRKLEKASSSSSKSSLTISTENNELATPISCLNDRDSNQMSTIANSNLFTESEENKHLFNSTSSTTNNNNNNSSFSIIKSSNLVNINSVFYVRPEHPKRKRGRPKKNPFLPLKTKQKQIPILPANKKKSLEMEAASSDLLPSGNYKICLGEKNHKKPQKDSAAAAAVSLLGHKFSVGHRKNSPETNLNNSFSLADRENKEKGLNESILSNEEERNERCIEDEIKIKTGRIEKNSEINEEFGSNFDEKYSGISNVKIEKENVEVIGENSGYSNVKIKKGKEIEKKKEKLIPSISSENGLVISNCFSLVNATHSDPNVLFNSADLDFHTTLSASVTSKDENPEARSSEHIKRLKTNDPKLKVKPCSVMLEPLSIELDSNISTSNENQIPCKKSSENSSSLQDQNCIILEDSPIKSTGMKQSMKMSEIFNSIHKRKTNKRSLPVDKSECSLFMKDFKKLNPSSKTLVDSKDKTPLVVNGEERNPLKQLLSEKPSGFDTPDSLWTDLGQDNVADLFLSRCIDFHERQLELLYKQIEQHKNELEKLSRAKKALRLDM